MTEDDAVTLELAEILGRMADLTSKATFTDNDAVPSLEVIQRLRLSGLNSEADELAELHTRAAELRNQHRPKH